MPGEDEFLGPLYYPGHIVFKAHPDMAIARSSIVSVTWSNTQLSIGLGHRRSDAFKQTYEVHNELVTHPPVTRMVVGTWNIGSGSDQSDYADDLDDSDNLFLCPLHIPEGIPFKDVHGFFQGLS